MATPDFDNPEGLKGAVKAFWEDAACGEAILLPVRDEDGFAQASRKRYELEPCLTQFARFERFTGARVLEIGVGIGADHERFLKAGAQMTGIDLTDRAIEITRGRLANSGLESDLRTGDAEALPFADASFDHVYSWGVIHHTPKTAKAAAEILRVLRPGGTFAVMIYHRYSLTGFMLWLRYGLLRGNFSLSLSETYARYLESAGTKAYSLAEARALFSGASEVSTQIELAPADLLASHAGQRHGDRILAVAKKMYPRWLARRLLARCGLYLLISGSK